MSSDSLQISDVRKRKVANIQGKGSKKQRRWLDDEVSEVLTYMVETIERGLIIEVSEQDFYPKSGSVYILIANVI